MMYANDDYTMFSSVKTKKFKNEVSDDFIRNKIKEDCIVYKFNNNLIDTMEFISNIRSISLDFFTEINNKMREYNNLKESRSILGEWTEEDELKYQNIVKTYNELYEEFKQKKQEVSNLIFDKDGLISFYENLLLRFEEIRNNFIYKKW